MVQNKDLCRIIQAVSTVAWYLLVLQNRPTRVQGNAATAVHRGRWRNRNTSLNVWNIRGKFFFFFNCTAVSLFSLYVRSVSLFFMYGRVTIFLYGRVTIFLYGRVTFFLYGRVTFSMYDRVTFFSMYVRVTLFFYVRTCHFFPCTSVSLFHVRPCHVVCTHIQPFWLWNLLPYKVQVSLLATCYQFYMQRCASPVSGPTRFFRTKNSARRWWLWTSLFTS